MATLHYEGLIGISLAVSSATIKSGMAATVWTAKTGGTQLLDIIDESGGVGGTVRSGPDGRYQFQVIYPDGEESAVVWLDFGVGQRWPFRCLEMAISSNSGVVPVGGEVREVLMRTAPTEVGWGSLGADDVGADPAGAVSDHEARLDPHPQYARFVGQATGARFWGGNTFPTAADGAQDGDYLFYEG